MTAMVAQFVNCDLTYINYLNTDNITVILVLATQARVITTVAT